MTYAIVTIAGHQYKVKPGDELTVNLLPNKAGEIIDLDQVLLVNNADETLIGTPYVANANLKAEIVDTTKADKIRVFKYKSKSRYRKTQGHRAKLSLIKIVDDSDQKAIKAKPKSPKTKLAK